MKVTNFEISKKLAEIAFNVPSNFMVKPDGKIIATQKQIIGKIPSFSKPNEEGCKHLEDGYASYCLETLLDVFPNFHVHNQENSQWVNFSDYNEQKEYFEDRKENESLADCAGRLIIKLYEQNLINFNKCLIPTKY